MRLVQQAFSSAHILALPIDVAARAEHLQRRLLEHRLSCRFNTVPAVGHDDAGKEQVDLKRSSKHASGPSLPVAPSAFGSSPLVMRILQTKMVNERNRFRAVLARNAARFGTSRGGTDGARQTSSALGNGIGACRAWTANRATRDARLTTG